MQVLTQRTRVARPGAACVTNLCQVRCSSLATAVPSWVSTADAVTNVAKLFDEYAETDLPSASGSEAVSKPVHSAALSPASLRGRPNPGALTPRKLARLCDVLDLPLKRIEALLSEHPEVKQLDIDQIQERVLQLCALLKLPRDNVLYIVTRQAYYFLCTPFTDITARVQLLAHRLGVPDCAVLKAAGCVPSLLKREPELIVRKVQQCATLLETDCLQALHVIARAPEYLSHSPGVIKKRLKALNLITRCAPRLICRMALAQPDVVFLSPRILNNKIKVLMAILNKDKRAIITLVFQCPALLRYDLKRASAAYTIMQHELQRPAGYVFAMVCHDPWVLLLSPAALQRRAAYLLRCISGHACWAREWSGLKPPLMQQLLTSKHHVLLRLGFTRAALAAHAHSRITATGGIPQQQGKSPHVASLQSVPSPQPPVPPLLRLGLMQTMSMGSEQWAKRWPAYAPWLAARQQRTAQHIALGQQHQQSHQEQGQTVPTPQPRQQQQGHLVPQPQPGQQQPWRQYHVQQPGRHPLHTAAQHGVDGQAHAGSRSSSSSTSGGPAPGQQQLHQQHMHSHSHESSTSASSAGVGPVAGRAQPQSRPQTGSTPAGSGKRAAGRQPFPVTCWAHAKQLQKRRLRRQGKGKGKGQQVSGSAPDTTTGSSKSGSSSRSGSESGKGTRGRAHSKGGPSASRVPAHLSAPAAAAAAAIAVSAARGKPPAARAGRAGPPSPPMTAMTRAQAQVQTQASMVQLQPVQHLQHMDAAAASATAVSEGNVPRGSDRLELQHVVYAHTGPDQVAWQHAGSYAVSPLQSSGQIINSSSSSMRVLQPAHAAHHALMHAEHDAHSGSMRMDPQLLQLGHGPVLELPSSYAQQGIEGRKVNAWGSGPDASAAEPQPVLHASRQPAHAAGRQRRVRVAVHARATSAATHTYTHVGHSGWTHAAAHRRGMQPLGA